MAFAVVIHEKGGQPRRQEFYKSEVTVGRVQGNDIVLPKQNVSKRHSRVVLKNGKFVITDLKSTNGTYVNGRKISSPSVIKETDKIYIGDFVLSTELIEGAEQGASSSAAAPPPPPRTPPYASGSMPAQTIASNMSPFAATQVDASEDYAKTAGALPLPSDQGSPAPASPFSPVTSIASEPPVHIPPASSMPPAPTMRAPSTPTPTPPPATPVVAAPVPPVATPAPPVIATPAVATPSAPLTPMSSASLIPIAPKASSAPQPNAVVAMDLSVFDGEESTGVMALHQELMSGLSQRSIALPTRYRPGQQLNPELLSAVSEIVSNAARGQSDDEINQVIDEALSVGRLLNLIEDPNVSSIYLNGAHELVSQNSGGKVSVTHLPFSSVHQARMAAARIINGMGAAEGSGITQAEGMLGSWQAYVDLRDVGPYVSLHRVSDDVTLDQWVAEGRANAHNVSLLSNCLSSGGKVAIASSDVRAQTQLLSALLGSSMKGRRVVNCGISHGIGVDASWLTIPTDMDALMNVSMLAPEALVIGDIAAFDGALVLETLSSTSSGAILVTARSAQGALAKLRRRALDPSLVSEAIDYIAFVSSSEHGPVLSELISVE